MTLVFLLVLFACETGLTVYVSKHGQYKKALLLVRLAELVLFGLFLLLPGFHWSFRFGMIAGLLVVRLLIATILYFRKKEKKPTTKRLVLNQIGSMVLIVFALVPVFVFTGYQGLETTGPYAVKSESAILSDPARKEAFETDGSNREVPVHVFYPDTEGKFPVVVFSHGAFGWYQSNMSTYMELASNGYVVVALDHPYHSMYTTDSDGKTIIANPEFLNDVMAVNNTDAEGQELLEMEQAWMDLRTGDINFVVDEIKAGHLPQSELMDTEKIGLMGHSMGGAASVAVGRQRDDISAVIDLDGTMLGERTGYENGKYAVIEEAYPVPLLSMDNEEHHITGQQLGEDYVNVYVTNHALDGTNTWIAGSGHMNFTDLPLFAPPLAKMLGTGSIDSRHCIETMNGVVLNFFDVKLKDEGELAISERYD